MHIFLFDRSFYTLAVILHDAPHVYVRCILTMIKFNVSSNR